jgi:hypothetical protein
MEIPKIHHKKSIQLTCNYSTKLLEKYLGTMVVPLVDCREHIKALFIAKYLLLLQIKLNSALHSDYIKDR